MTESFFQRVYNIIQPTLPEGWNKIVLYTAFMQESCEIKYFVKKSDETEFRDCFEIIDNHMVLLEVFSGLRDVISEERDKIDKKDQWKFATITIDSEGNFEIFYDYSDGFWKESNFIDLWNKKYMR